MKNLLVNLFRTLFATFVIFVLAIPLKNNRLFNALNEFFSAGGGS